MERLYAGIFGALVLRTCIGALDPCKCIDSNSPAMFLKTIFLENQFYMERLYAGILEHWSFGESIDSIALLYF